jgi:serine-type D-Ala-D-Ala carboxypeptidase/endopeptidase
LEVVSASNTHAVIRSIRLVAGLLACALPACGLFDNSEPADLVGCRSGYTDVGEEAAARLAESNVADAALILRVDGQNVCRLFVGEYTSETRVATVSAAKWLTAATVMAVVDKGSLQLDTKVSEIYPLTPELTASIQLSQLLSHTSGLLWFSRCMGRADYTLQECAEQILEGDVQFDAGAGFFYGGPPFTVAGAMAEKISGKTWADLFKDAIADPLGMHNTSFGTSPNPALSEGAVVSSVDDYANFAQMILNRGVFDGRRILSESAVAQMRKDWRGSAPIVYSPRGDRPYALGAWVDESDEAGVGTVLTSPGAGGFVPIVDFNRNMVVVFATEDPDVWPALTAILEKARAAVDRER